MCASYLHESVMNLIGDFAPQVTSYCFLNTKGAQNRLYKHTFGVFKVMR